jgi:hypothetical protein
LTMLQGTEDLSVATSQHRVRHRADCEYSCPAPGNNHAKKLSRFAFVEYENRRDADDAYYEMHNKRIGRDDLLKIEVHDCECER